MRRLVLLAAAVAVFVLLASACSSGSGGETDNADEELTRVSESGGVTVSATWMISEALDAVRADLGGYDHEDFVVVEISLDTHSGDLGDIDLVAEASLRQGGAVVAPQAWMSTSDDSHHRSGLLVFPRQVARGPVSLSLVIEGQEVILLWEETPATQAG